MRATSTKGTNGSWTTSRIPDSSAMADGVAYVDHRIFAFADRSIVDWYCHADDKHWPLMILTPAE
jgi:hypothetical protein